MRYPIALLSLSILSIVPACGDDDGGGASEETSGPSSTEESSSSVSVGESDESSSSTDGEDSSTGVDSGSSEGSGSESGSESDSGSTGDSSGSETSSASTFACGDALECDLATQYCQRQVSDVGGIPDSYQCMPLPDGCAGVSECDCLGDEPCGEFDLCEAGPEGGAILSCPGG